MSAFIVSNKTIDAIVYGMTVPECVGRDEFRYMVEGFDFPFADEIGGMFTELDSCRRIGQALLNYNAISVGYRYDEEPEPYPFEPVEHSMMGICVMEPYTDSEVYGACRCWLYQSCETDDYKDAPEYRAVDGLKSALERKAARKVYDTAIWEL